MDDVDRPRQWFMAMARWDIVVPLALVLFVAFAQLDSRVGHVRYAATRLMFNDDARQWIFPLFRYTGEGALRGDVIGDYYLSVMPVGYWLLYRGLAPLVDPATLSKILPYPLLLVALLGVVMAARHLGGAPVVLMALALALQAPEPFARMTGGLPRSFAFPLLSLGLWALVAGRARMLAALVVVAQAFYPVAAVILGLSLATLLFLVPRADRGDASGWSRRQRIMALALVAMLATAVFIPVSLATAPWGRMLGPADAAGYPEIGPGGRFGPEDRAPFRALPTQARLTLATTLSGAGPPLLPTVAPAGRVDLVVTTLAVLLALGAISLAVRSQGARRSLALALGSSVGYLAARAMAPHLSTPQRYVAYSLPLLVMVGLPAGAAALARLAFRRQPRRGAAVGAVAAVGIVLLLLGRRGDPASGYTVAIAADTRLYDFLRTLPREALIAGWPDGAINNVAYVSRRRAFVTLETHQPIHQAFALEMRRRMRILIPALLGDDATALRQLRGTFGVTHLIVDVRHFSRPPQYFAPFDADVTRTWLRGHQRGFAAEAILDRAAVFREGPIAVLELSRL
jgi:hypothetical protein